jgi:hypothetical protein
MKYLFLALLIFIPFTTNADITVNGDNWSFEDSNATNVCVAGWSIASQTWSTNTCDGNPSILGISADATTASGFNNPTYSYHNNAPMVQVIHDNDINFGDDLATVIAAPNTLSYFYFEWGATLADGVTCYGIESTTECGSTEPEPDPLLTTFTPPTETKYFIASSTCSGSSTSSDCEYYYSTTTIPADPETFPASPFNIFIFISFAIIITFVFARLTYYLL